MQRFHFLTAIALSAGLAVGCADTGNNAGTASDAETGAVNEPPDDPAVEEEPATELPEAGAATE
jgi:hypothetical protein